MVSSADCLLDVTSRARLRRSAHIVRAGFLEHGETLLHVVLSVMSVNVHANNCVARRTSDGAIQTSGHDTLGIIEDLNPWMPRRVFFQLFSCAVGAASVCDEDFEFRIDRKLLAQQRGKKRVDVCLLVPARDDNGNAMQV